MRVIIAIIYFLQEFYIKSVISAFILYSYIIFTVLKTFCAHLYIYTCSYFSTSRFPAHCLLLYWYINFRVKNDQKKIRNNLPHPYYNIWRAV